MSEFMLVRREGNWVRVWIENGLGVEGAKWSPFSIETPSPLYAEALSTAILDALSKRIEAVRREEYEAGWRDAKRKSLKRDYFFKTLWLRS